MSHTDTPTVVGNTRYADLTASFHGKCPFCTLHRQRVLVKNAAWAWIICRRPYRAFHTLLVPLRHLHRMEDLTTKEWELFLSLKQRATLDLRLGGFSVQGKPIENTIMMIRERGIAKDIASDHLHVHLLPEFEGMLNPICEADAAKGTWHKEIQRLIDPSVSTT